MAIWIKPVLVSLTAVLFLINGSTDALAQKPLKKRGGAHLVEVVTVQKIPLSFEAERTGTLSARRVLRVFNQEEGRVEKIPLREGDEVKASAPLIELDRKILSAELAKARANRREAERNLARVQELSKRKVSTEERLGQAQKDVSVARAEEALISTRLGYTTIVAPFDGVVIERLIEPGDIAPKYSHLMTIIDPSSLYTKVSVSELMLPRLGKGNPVDVRIDALGRERFPGRIARIHPVVDPKTRQGVVEIAFDKVPKGARAGQLCRVSLRTAEENRLAIPFEALRRDPKGEFVFAVIDGRAISKRVRTGMRLKGRAEILEGVREGDQVVVRGFLDLREGKKVELVTKGPNK